MSKPRRKTIPSTAGEQAPHEPWWRQHSGHVRPIIGLFFVTLLAYSNSFFGEITLDSQGLLMQERVHAATWENIKLILGHTYWWPYGESGLYRPITTLSYLFNYAVMGNGEQAAGYHAINFLLHAGNVLLVYLLGLRLWKTGWKAFALAALWAVHPVLTESVTNIAGRPDLLAGMSVLGGSWTYLKSTESEGNKRWGWLAGLMVAALLGVFSKENAVVLIGAMALFEVSFGWNRKRVSALGFGCLAVLPAIVAMFVARAAVLSKMPPAEFPFLDNPLTAAGFWTAKLTAIRILAKYLGLLAWPANLSFDYSYSQIPLVSGSAADWAGWAVAAAVCAGAVLAYRLERRVFFAIGFAFLTFLPTSNLVVTIGTVMAERFLYLPAVGFAICLVLAADGLTRMTGQRRTGPILLIAIGAILAGRTWARNSDWRNAVTVTAAGVNASPNSYKTHRALALALFQADPDHANLDRVLAEAEKGLAVLKGLPDEKMDPEAFLQAADYYRAQGDLQAIGTPSQNALPKPALQAYERELQMLLRSRSILEARHRVNVESARARKEPLPELSLSKWLELENSISAAYLRLGDPAKSAAEASAAIARAPGTPGPYVLLASARFSVGDPDDAAIALFEGLFATADLGLRSKLEMLYQNGFAAPGCAIVAGPSGPQINPSCEIVRRHACSAAARLDSVYARMNRADLASRTTQNAETMFGCGSLR